MSRIGKLPIAIPSGVTVEYKDGIVSVKGPKGEMSQKVDSSIKVNVADGHVTFEVDENSPVNIKQKQAFHGLYRALGYTHPIFIELPKEVKVETKSERNQNPLLMLESCDKQLLGLICAKIRSFRKPEPYKGKGILFQGEVIRRKSGKTAAAK